MPLRSFRLAVFLVATLGLLLYAPAARAHCDTLSGPVVKTAKAALEAKDLRPLLKWVKADAEPELRSAFEAALGARAEGAKARELADRYFLETTVRLHRAGEGAPYTGLKAEADDPTGLIGASDTALDRGSADPLLTAVTGAVSSALREKYARVVESRKHAEESVEAGRRFVQAYVEYVHFVEALQQAIGAGGHATEAAHRHGQ